MDNRVRCVSSFRHAVAHHARTGRRPAVRDPPTRDGGSAERKSRAGWQASASTTTRALNAGTSPALRQRARRDRIGAAARPCRARPPVRTRSRREHQPHPTPHETDRLNSTAGDRAVHARRDHRRARDRRQQPLDIVAANTLGYALYSDMFRGTARPANHSRFIFLDPRAYDFYPDWDRAANVNVAILRRDAAASPTTPGSQPSSESSPSAATSSAPLGRPTTCAATTPARRASSTPPSGISNCRLQGMELEDFPVTPHVYPAVPGTPTQDALKLLGPGPSANGSLNAPAPPPGDPSHCCPLDQSGNSRALRRARRANATPPHSKRDLSMNAPTSTAKPPPRAPARSGSDRRAGARGRYVPDDHDEFVIAGILRKSPATCTSRSARGDAHHRLRRRHDHRFAPDDAADHPPPEAARASARARTVRRRPHRRRDRTGLHRPARRPVHHSVRYRAFWALASVVAARAAGPQLGSRAQGVVGAGGSLGTVLGVPARCVPRPSRRLARHVLGHRRRSGPPRRTRRPLRPPRRRQQPAHLNPKRVHRPPLRTPLAHAPRLRHDHGRRRSWPTPTSHPCSPTAPMLQRASSPSC